MSYHAVMPLLAAELRDDAGWRHVEGTNQFAHKATGVHIAVYARDVVLAFRDEPGRPATKALGTRTTLHPGRAVAAVVEVARALVAVRSRAVDGGPWGRNDDQSGAGG